MTAADSRRIRLVSDAVVSSYIRDISTRASSGDAAPETARLHGARADRRAHTRRALRRRANLAHARRAHQAVRHAAATATPQQPPA
jgi:hypothetical protein